MKWQIRQKNSRFLQLSSTLLTSVYHYLSLILQSFTFFFFFKSRIFIYAINILQTSHHSYFTVNIRFIPSWMLTSYVQNENISMKQIKISRLFPFYFSAHICLKYWHSFSTKTKENLPALEIQRNYKDMDKSKEAHKQNKAPQLGYWNLYIKMKICTAKQCSFTKWQHNISCNEKLGNKANSFNRDYAWCS